MMFLGDRGDLEIGNWEKKKSFPSIGKVYRRDCFLRSRCRMEWKRLNFFLKLD